MVELVGKKSAAIFPYTTYVLDHISAIICFARKITDQFFLT